MEKNIDPTLKMGYTALCAIVCWFAVICQFILMVENRVVPIPETILRFFSFFTILTNIMVAIAFTVNIKPAAGFAMFRSFSSLTALLLYILVVGIVYNVILRSIWSPTGLQELVDELLHLVVPLLFLLYWIIFTIKEQLPWAKLWYWLCYPAAYLVFILTIGSFTNFYPYPFVDVNVLGILTVLVNSVYLLLFFIAISALLIFLSRKITKIKAH